MTTKYSSKNNTGTIATWNRYGILRMALLLAVITGTGLEAQTIPGAVGYWPLDDGAGTVAADASGLGNTGTISNGSWISGKVAGALSFAGTGRVNCGNASMLSPTTGITMACWIKTAQAATAFTSILRHDGHFTALQLDTDGTAHVMVWANGTLLLIPFQWTGVWNDNAWHHFAATYDQAAGLNVYKDGVSVMTSTLALGPLPSSTTAPLVFASSENNNEFFTGALDEVRMYSRALTAAEVQSLGNAPPAIITQPVNQTTTVGATATLSVVANGTAPLAYQWSRSNDGGTTWAAISGATSSSYTTPTTVAGDNAAKFRVVVSNSLGSITSAIATLTVNAATPPTVTTQPANASVPEGAQASFSVVVSGSAPLAFQWSRSNDGGTSWAQVGGATSATYAFLSNMSDNGAKFRVQASNPAGSITSATATLTVIPAPPTITVQPSNQTVTVGATATFSVTATGSLTLGYQWMRSNDGGTTWATIPGATSASYVTAATVPADNAAKFRVVVSNGPTPATSSAATLTVTAAVAPTIATQPANQTVTLGSTATFTVVANGTAPLSYQWSRSNDGGTTWAAISGATATSYTTPATVAGDNGAVFRVAVSNSAGSVTTTTASLTVTISTAGLLAYWPLDDGTGLTAADVSGNHNTGTITNGVWRTGKVGGCLSFSGNGMVNAGNAAILAPTNGISVACWIKTGQAASATTSVLRHNGHFTGLQLGTDGTAHATVWAGGVANQVPFAWNGVWNDLLWHHFAVTYDQSNGLRVYKDGQFVAGMMALTGILPASPSAPLMLAASESGGEYFLGALDDVRVYSRALTAVEVQVLGTKSSANTAPVVNAGPDFTVNGTATLAGSASDDGLPSPPGAMTVTWTMVSGPGTVTFANGNAAATTATFSANGTYTLRLTASDGTLSTSDDAVVTFNAPIAPAITTQPANQLVPPGSTATFSVVATGTAPLTYQWSRSNDGGLSWTALNGATATSYTTPAAVAGDNGAKFRVVVTNGAGSATSAIGTLTVGTGLVAYWPLDAGTGTSAVDASGNGNTGTIVNGTWISGKLAGALSFAGAGTVACGTSATLSPRNGITVACWIKTAQAATAFTSILRHDGHFTALQLDTDGTAHVMVWANGTLLLIPFQWTGVWNDNTWHHFAATYDQAAGLNVYKDGVSVLTSTLALGLLPASTTAPFMLGGSEQNNEFFTGSLDDVRVYARALSVTEVQSLLSTAPTITVQPANQTVTAGSTATFAVTASGSAPLAYQWSRSNDGGTNWTAINGATASSYTTAATTVGDNAAMFRVAVSNAAGSVTSMAATLTVKPQVAFAVASSSADEGIGQTTIAVTLSQVCIQPVTVTYAVTGGTATGGGVDYQLPNGVITIPVGQSSGSIVVPIREDALVEGNETVIITLSAPSGAVLGAISSHTLTIIDNDAVAVQVAASDPTASETGHVGSFTITRAGSTASALTVNLGWSGTATKGSDYQDPGATIVIPTGCASVVIPIVAIDDTLQEPTETVVLTLASGSGYALGATTTATVSIIDNDVVTIAATTPQAAEAATPTAGVFTISRTGSTAAALTVSVALTGTATLGSDYTASPSATSVTIPAGAASATVTVTPINDAIVEGLETVIATLPASTSYTVGSASSATVQISDDEVPTVTIAATDAVASEPGSDTATFTVTRSAATASALTVTYAVSGTATNGVDYTSLSGTAIIPANATSTTVVVTPLGDQITEPDETVILTLSTSTAYNIGASSSATATIHDCAVSLTATDAIASETGTDTGTIVVSRTGSTTAALTVTVAWSGTATPTTDFTTSPSVSTTVTIPAGAASTTITLTPVADAIVEGAETATLSLVPNPSYTLGNSSDTVTINDAVLTVAVDQPTIHETGTGSIFTITRTGNLSAAVTVPVVWSGTATKGTDYTVYPSTSSVTLAANVASTTISLSPIIDSIVEGTETAILTIGPVAGYGITTSSSTVSIIDDNTPTVTVEPTDATAKEAGQDPAVFTLRRNLVTSSALTVNLSVGGTATPTVDYTTAPASITSVTIPANVATATVTITPVDDTIVEAPETVILTPIAGTGYYPGVGATITIYDNETPKVSITAPQPSAAEGGASGQFLASRIGNLDTAITVNLAITGTATNGTDYTTIPATVAMPIGAASVPITVAPIDDTLVEGNETVVMTITSGSGYTIGSPTAATVTIADNDLPTVAIAATSPHAAEGSTPVTGVFTVSRTGPTTAAMSVTLAYSGTATSSSDYSVSPSGTTISIPAGSASTTVTVTPVNDSVVEGDEMVIATIQASSLYVIGTVPSATVIIADDEKPTVSIVATDPIASEPGTDTGTFTVTRSAASAAALTVPYSVGGTATPGNDYIALSGTVTIPANAISTTITITPRDDLEVEATETVDVTLLAGSGYTLGTAIATVSILDDDLPAPIISYQQVTSTTADLFGLVPRNHGITALVTTSGTSGVTATPAIYGDTFQAHVVTTGPTSAIITLTFTDASGHTSPATTAIVRFASGGPSVSGDATAVPPAAPTVTITIAPTSLTGDKTGLLNGENVSFTKLGLSSGNAIQVQVTTTTTFGAIQEADLLTSDGQIVRVPGGTGTAWVVFPGEGRYELSATAFAINGSLTAMGTTTQPTVLIVDRTPPVLTFMSASRYWLDPSAPECFSVLPGNGGVDFYDYAFFLNGNQESGANGNMALRKSHGGHYYNYSDFEMDVSVQDASGGLATGGISVKTDGAAMTVQNTLGSDGQITGLIVTGFGSFGGVEGSAIHHMGFIASDRAGNSYGGSTFGPGFFCVPQIGLSQTTDIYDQSSFYSPVRFLTNFDGQYSEIWQGSAVDESKRMLSDSGNPNYVSPWLLHDPIDISAIPYNQKNPYQFTLRDICGNTETVNSGYYGLQALQATAQPQLYQAGIFPFDEFGTSSSPSTKVVYGGNSSIQPSVPYTVSTMPGWYVFNVEVANPGGNYYYFASGRAPGTTPPTTQDMGGGSYMYPNSYLFAPLFVGPDNDTRHFKPAIAQIPSSWDSAPIGQRTEIRDSGMTQCDTVSSFTISVSSAFGTSAGPNAVWRSAADTLVYNFAPSRPSNTNARNYLGTSPLTYGLTPFYSTVFPYTNVGSRWLSSLALYNDMAYSGAKQTIRLYGNFLSTSFSPDSFVKDGDYVHFTNNGSDLTVTAAQYRANPDPNLLAGKIAITGQRFIMVGPRQTEVQILELDIRVGTSAPADYYDLDINCGAVHGYHDSLSLQSLGSNGAYRMKKAFSVVGLRTETQSQSIATSMAKSRSVPQISVTNSSLAIAGSTGSLQLSGTLIDPIADLIPQSVSKSVHVYHVGQWVGDIPLTPVADTVSDWKPYAHHFTFSGSVNIPLWEGPHDLEIVADANEMGVDGHGQFTATLNASYPDSFGATQATITMSNQLQDALPDVLLLNDFITGSGSPAISLSETSATSLDFKDSAGIYEVVLTELSVAQADDDWMYATATKNGTPLLDGVFYRRSGTSSTSFPAPFDLKSVTTTGGSTTFSLASISSSTSDEQASSFVPYRLRLDGPPGLIDKVANGQTWYQNGKPVALANSGGSYYVQDGSHPKVMVDAEFAFPNAEVGEAPPANGQNSSSLIPYAGSISVGGTKMTVVLMAEPEKDGVPSDSINATVTVATTPLGKKATADAQPYTIHDVSISQRDLASIPEGSYSGTVKRQDSIQGVGNASANGTLPTTAPPKTYLDSKLTAWTYFPKVSQDPGIDDSGWVWNIDDNQALTSAVPLWAIPDLLGQPASLSLESSIVAALKGSIATIGDDHDRLIIDTLTVATGRGWISHWELPEAQGVYNYMTRHLWYQAGDALPAGKNVGDRNDLFFEKNGTIDLTAAVSAYNGETLKNNRDIYLQRLRRRAERDAAIGAMHFREFTAANLVKGSVASLSAIGQIMDPFTVVGCIAGGRNIVLPSEEDATWAAVAVEGGAILLNFVPLGKVVAKGKVLFKRLGSVEQLPAKRLPMRDLESGELAAKACVNMCFVAGTQVKVPGGYRSIERIQAGDLVWSRDQVTGAEGFKPVVQTVVTAPTALIHLFYSDGWNGPNAEADQELIGTAPHPFWVEQRQAWVPMGELRSGYDLRLESGKHVTVCSTVTEQSANGQHFTAYNFEVADWHTYFVAPTNAAMAAGAVWVHNAGATFCDTLWGDTLAQFKSLGEESFKSKYINEPEWVINVLRSQATEVALTTVQKRAIWDNMHQVWKYWKGAPINVMLPDSAIHHRIPLEWTHLYPGENPNRIDNLFGVSKAIHTQITAAWNTWRNQFPGKITKADVETQAAKIDGAFHKDNWVRIP
jgi:hypothetical protein